MHRIITLLFILVVRSLALAPPGPDFIDWEPVHEMRLRQNITYKYKPSYLSDEDCRHLSEQECEKQDKNTERAIKERRLNPSIAPDGVRVLVLLVKFTDHDDKTYPLPSRDYYDTLLNGIGKSDTNPVGSTKEWLRYNSLGKYRVSFDVRDWETTTNTEAYFANGVSGRVGNIALQPMFTPILEKFDNAGSIDWYNGYVDEFGYLNHLVVIHSGIAAEWGNKPCVSADYTNRIWSQGSGTANPDETWVSKDWFAVNGYCVSSAFDEPTCDSDVQPLKMGIVTHEFMHGFQLLDMYDQDTSAPKIQIGGTAKYDIMSNAIGWDRSRSIPGHLAPFSRITANWLTPIEITKNGFYAIQPAETSSHVYMIKQGYPVGEYLLIENRQKIKWDQNWGGSGIVIYHVDEKADGQRNRGWPGSSGFPKKHYMVAVEQADGKYEIEENISQGDQGDFWTKGMILPADGNYPKTYSYQGGNLKATGITIEVLSDSGFIMLFKVSGLPETNPAPLYPGASIAPTSAPGSAPDGSPYLRPQNEPTATSTTLAWVLSMLGGVGLMLGILFIIL